MIKQDKSGLIWSYIFKVINFLIFRDFSKKFLNLFGFISTFKIRNVVLISRADMVANVVGAITRRHMVTCVHFMWHTRVLVRACVRVCACVRARACVRVCACVCV